MTVFIWVMTLFAVARCLHQFCPKEETMPLCMYLRSELKLVIDLLNIRMFRVYSALYAYYIYLCVCKL
jgi:hypothetical protein